jgi:acetamidase/formamidase
VSLGDVHAAMGDGEVGTVELMPRLASSELHPEMHLKGPIVTTQKKTVFLASARSVELAAAVAFENAVASLVEKTGLLDKDAHITASIAGNAKICQLVNGDVTIGFELPSEVLKW